MNVFWKATNDGTQFNLFSIGHIISLSVIIGIIFLIYINKEKLKAYYIRKKVKYIIGAVLFLQQFFLYLWYVDSGNFTMQESLPLYLCRLTAILSIIMVVRESYNIFEVVYFWGLGGATLALLTPDTGGFVFPHWMWIQFFIGHGGILIALFFMIFVYEYRPTINSLRNTILWTLGYVVIVDTVNYLIDANYSYLRNKPYTTTFLDALPNFPYYVLIALFLIIVIFSFLYIPFYIKDRKKSRLNRII